MAANFRQPLVKMEKLAREPWTSLLALNVDIQSLEMKKKEVMFDAACIGGPAENFLEIMKKQKISVSSLHLGGFQLISDCPADQFYQRLLRAGQISPRSE